MLRASGPLRTSIVDDTADPARPDTQPNGQIVLRRIAWLDENDDIPENKQSNLAYERLWRWWSNRCASNRATELLAAADTRRGAALRRLESRGHHAEEIEAKPVWRTVVGLGDEVPQETGMRLHGTYGVPILPGQSLKGLAAIEGAEEPDLMPSVMGSPRPGGNPAGAEPGEVIFLDALPTRVRMAMDVITPHVAEYYEHNLPPAEYWQPNPVSFLVLDRGTTFRIHVVSRGTDTSVSVLARTWLCKGLTERGVGAKTSAGYGYMSVPGDD